MHLNIVSLLVILGVVATIHGQNEYTVTDLGGRCPKISYVSNLNGPRVLGWWYRVFSSFESPLCYNGNEGQTMYTAGYNDTTLNLDWCCRSAADPTVATCGAKVGTGTTVSSKNGEFVYQFDDQSWLCHPLDTDYDNFAIVYGCKPDTGEELVFVISRDYTLKNELVPRVDNVLRRNRIGWSKLKPVKHGPSTPYTPNSRNCGRH